MESATTGRVALVTGGSRGIGRAIAERLAAAGCRTTICYLGRSDAAQEVVDGIRARGGEALSVQADVRSEDAVRDLIGAVEAAFGSVDVLINNAGIARDGLLVRMSPQDWRDVIETNLTGAFLCTKAVLRRMMRKRWGRIVNVSSVSALAGNVGQANYAAAKAGLVGFTRSVAKEVASRNITVNAVAPGFIETDMTAGLPDDLREQALALTPVGRFGSPEEVASLVAFLTSDEAAYITGQVISIDGGLAMR